jgi:hypothetical protein
VPGRPRQDDVVPDVAEPLVCERCGYRDERVVMRPITPEISVPLCDQCEEVRTGTNEASQGLAWIFWVFLATLVLFAVVVGIVVIALD